MKAYNPSQNYRPSPTGYDYSQQFGAPYSYDQPPNPQVISEIYGDVPPQGQHTLYQQSNEEYNANVNVNVLQFPQCTSENDKTQTNWTVPAVLVSLFCCFPFGIWAIIFARNANKAASEGDYKRAKQNAATARNLIISAVIYGIICFFLILAYITITNKST